ncbi:Protein AIM2 [Cytospora mali]|uniref:Protein AIM2 n=1 Tax=Cytospora mali TaxID=578113 RepID=A0A194VH67_CYTMA|nr:Protein AIM2 [Valsa mali var. pyri (nom. inval.)]
MSDNEGFIAKPSAVCCLDGNIHDGKPRGRYTTIADVETYIARPGPGRDNGRVVFYFPDVWGLFTNTLLIVDAFADAGYLTVALDYFRGDPVWKHRRNRHDNNIDFDYQAWKEKHTTFADGCVPKWVDAVKQQYGSVETRYACVGYCFGAPYVCNALADDMASVGAFAHPAFLQEHHFANLKGPLFLSCSEIDHTFETPSRRLALDILQSRKKSYHLQLFSGVEHGFALRGNMDNPYERYVKEESLKGIIQWFDFWLSQE